VFCQFASAAGLGSVGCCRWKKFRKIGWSLEEETFTQFQTENMHNNKNIERGDRRLGNAAKLREVNCFLQFDAEHRS
jgi:hypothetical protein